MAHVIVNDPETGEEVHLIAHMKDGRVLYRRMPAANTDLSQASPAKLEAMAEFADVASQTYGTTSEDGLPPAMTAVRDRLPGRRQKAPLPRELESEKLQAKFRGMLPTDVRELTEKMVREGRRITVAPRGRRGVVPITKRVVPELGELPLPPI